MKVKLGRVASHIFISALFMTAFNQAAIADASKGNITSSLSSSKATDSKKITVTAIGEISKLKGTVKAIDVNNKVRVLKLYSPIFPKDTLLTENNSYAGLRFTDGTLGVMRPDTVIKINTYVFVKPASADAAPSPKDHFKIKLGKGGLDINAGRISRGNPDAFQISTPAGKVNLKNPKANIAYIPNKGLAFQGTGTIQNLKGIKEILNNAYALVTSDNALPTIAATAPAFLITSQQVISSQYLQQEITEYGESAYYEETATYEEESSEAAMSEEDTSDEIATDESSSEDDSAATNDNEEDDTAVSEGDDHDDSATSEESDDDDSADDGSDDSGSGDDDGGGGDE